MEKPVRVLVVEDDDDINRLLCGVLTRSGYIPQPAYSGTEALLYLDRQVWSLVLLDLMLPGLRGEELLAAIGAKGDTPVIVITAENERETKIAALKTGADDYVTKPFDLEEVSARVDSLLRRFRRLPAAVPPKLLRHKDLVVDPEEKSATVGGRELSLTALLNGRSVSFRQRGRRQRGHRKRRFRARLVDRPRVDGEDGRFSSRGDGRGRSGHDLHMAVGGIAGFPPTALPA
jgi:Response regulators consisting of a CheY-like receiver domain and a winged-helix DNA-binding domain